MHWGAVTVALPDCEQAIVLLIIIFRNVELLLPMHMRRRTTHTLGSSDSAVDMNSETLMAGKVRQLLNASAH